MENIRFSIITVVLNRENTIERTIESIILQNYSNIEYIIVDGNSTDGTVSIIQRYNDIITKWISEPDEGIYDAMNKGISMATGDIIAFLNSDDWYEKDTLSYIAGQFETEDVDVVFAGMNEVKEDGLIVPHTADLSMIHKVASLYHPSTFARVDLFKKFGKYDVNLSIAADYDWMLRVLDGNAKAICVKKYTSYFTMGGVSSQYLFRTNTEVAIVAVRHARNSEEIAEIKKYYEEINRMLLYREKLSDLVRIFKREEYIDLPEDGRFYIFGAGSYGKKCYELLSQFKIPVYGFVDNDNTRWGSKYMEKEILPLQKLVKDRDFVIIATYEFENEMEEQLKREQYEKGKHYALYNEIKREIETVLEEKFGRIDFSKEEVRQ